MLKYSLLAIILAIPMAISKKSDHIDVCRANPIYCQIVKNSPKINKDYAMKLSNVIYFTAKLHNLDPRRYAAILAQESLYKLGAKNCKGEVCKDFGIAQINKATAKAYGFNLDKLTTDLAYSIQAGAIVLADFKKKYASRDNNWWSRYNASNSDKRKKYALAVSRYL